MRDKKAKFYTKKQTITLAGETIIIGPGTVPTSPAASAITSIAKISESLKRASRLGLFDSSYGTSGASK